MKKKSDFLLGVEYERRLRAIEDHLAEEERGRMSERLKYVENYHEYLKKALEDLPELDLRRLGERIDFVRNHLEQKIRQDWSHNRRDLKEIKDKHDAMVKALTEGEES